MTTSLTQERLKEVLHYNPDTGVFTWIKPTGPKARVGAVVGERQTTTYLQVGIDRKVYLLHRLAWLYVMGYIPDLIDHVDRNPRNNRFSNLAESNKSANALNMNPSKANKSGYVGVSFCKCTGRWRAVLTLQGKSKKLGRFDTPEEAHQAYLAAKAKYHTFQPVPRDV